MRDDNSVEVEGRRGQGGKDGGRERDIGGACLSVGVCV